MFPFPVYPKSVLKLCSFISVFFFQAEHIDHIDIRATEADLAGATAGWNAAVTEDIYIWERYVHRHGTELSTVCIKVKRVTNSVSAVAAAASDFVHQCDFYFGFSHLLLLSMTQFQLKDHYNWCKIGKKGGEKMSIQISELGSPLFKGIKEEDLSAMLSCIGYHIGTFQKGEIVAFEDENIRHIGILLSGAVDMIKEDLWGNKTMLVRMRKNELFGETFACGEDNLSVVTFLVSENADILFLPFDRVMHSCTMACVFHHQLIENMVKIIANKNRDLMRKMEIISKRTLREKILAYLSVQAQMQEARYFEIPLGRVELAEYLCADRSALTRELVRMKEDGLIDYDRNCFRIL